MIPKVNENGFALLDVVFALFLFTFGFVTFYGLTQGAIQENQEVFNLTEAANFAQNLMEELSAHPWSENLSQGKCIPGENVEGQDGRFQWKVNSEWEVPNELLKVQITVYWKEKGKVQNYSLDTLFSVQ
jgi:Tfp pilus assembly protein PilV